MIQAPPLAIVELVRPELIAFFRALFEIPIDAGTVVTSWWRDPEVNLAVGGVRNSFHLWGLALDVVAPDPPAPDRTRAGGRARGDRRTNTRPPRADRRAPLSRVASRLAGRQTSPSNLAGEARLPDCTPGTSGSAGAARPRPCTSAGAHRTRTGPIGCACTRGPAFACCRPSSAASPARRSTSPPFFPLWAPPIPPRAATTDQSLAGAGGPAGRWGDRVRSVNAKKRRTRRFSASARVPGRYSALFEPLARVTPARIGLQCSKPPKTASHSFSRCPLACSRSGSRLGARRGPSPVSSKAGMVAWTCSSRNGSGLAATWRSSSSSSSSSTNRSKSTARG